MALNPLYPRKDLLLTVDEVRDMLRTLVRVEKELGLEIDVMEALPKCVIPEELVSQGVFFTKRKCQAGITVCAVSSRGDVRPCTHNPKSYGNLLERDLKEIWKDMSAWRRMDFVPDECRECKLVASCHGACRINALTMNGSLKGRDIWTQKPVDEMRLFNPPIDLRPETRVRLVKCKMKTRPETDGYTLVCGRNGRQVTVVNDEVVKLINILGDKEVTVADIAKMGDVDADNPKVKSVIRHLINHKLMKLC
jgi:radical SAM protein with 4Fe4S-binding SPASM domain